MKTIYLVLVYGVYDSEPINEIKAYENLDDAEKCAKRLISQELCDWNSPIEYDPSQNYINGDNLYEIGHEGCSLEIWREGEGYLFNITICIRKVELK